MSTPLGFMCLGEKRPIPKDSYVPCGKGARTCSNVAEWLVPLIGNENRSHQIPSQEIPMCSSCVEKFLNGADDIGRSPVYIASKMTDDYVSAQLRLEKDEKNLCRFTDEELAREIGERVFKAALVFETVEGIGRLVGDDEIGLSLAQKVAKYAETLVLENVWNEWDEEKYAPSYHGVLKIRRMKSGE